MKRSRFTQEQIIGVLKEHEAGATAADQSCTQQERDLVAFAERAGYEVVGTYKETASGVKLGRAERSIIQQGTVTTTTWSVDAVVGK